MSILFLSVRYVLISSSMVYLYITLYDVVRWCFNHSWSSPPPYISSRDVWHRPPYVFPSAPIIWYIFNSNWICTLLFLVIFPWQVDGRHLMKEHIEISAATCILNTRYTFSISSWLIKYSFIFLFYFQRGNLDGVKISLHHGLASVENSPETTKRTNAFRITHSNSSVVLYQAK